jgi:hypothetical protein
LCATHRRESTCITESNRGDYWSARTVSWAVYCQQRDRVEPNQGKKRPNALAHTEWARTNLSRRLLGCVNERKTMGQRGGVSPPLASAIATAKRPGSVPCRRLLRRPNRPKVRRILRRFRSKASLFSGNLQGVRAPPRSIATPQLDHSSGTGRSKNIRQRIAQLRESSDERGTQAR